MTPKEKNPMSNRIEEGDRVKVDFTPRNETTQPYFYGTVLHTPSDVGDMWHLNFSGICICTQIDHNKQQIQWFMQVKTSYFYQSFKSYRKFIRRQWMKKT